MIASRLVFMVLDLKKGLLGMFNKAMLHLQLSSSSIRLYAFEHTTTKRGYLFMEQPYLLQKHATITQNKRAIDAKSMALLNY